MASVFPPAICTATSFGRLFHNNKHPSARPPQISCTTTNGGKVDRRNILIGLGGASFLTQDYSSSTFAAPVQIPNITDCGPPDLPLGVNTVDCCPPPTTSVIDFQPASPGKVRVRPAAHLADPNYVEKYKRAVELMRALPDSDPRSFTQQANLHCAYCNGVYEQLGFPVEFQVHNSWLFLPFHRFYLYFHEKILGELIGDPTFALPFWNYDAPGGMKMPLIYTDQISPLYDQLRNQNHLPPALLNLDYDGVIDPTVGDDAQIRSNLSIMHRQMVSNGRTPLLFFGSPYLAGDDPSPGSGSLENSSHNTVHLWCGDDSQPNREDMGSFYSAARDPIFYAHHSNVDRLWSIWKTLGGRRQDLQHPDWLNASFIFYDEKAQAVRAHVRDCLHTQTLGYVFQDVRIPWLQTRPTPRRALTNPASEPGPSKTRVRQANIEFPITLNSAMRTEVKRARKSRSGKEKEEKEEILVISGIEFDTEKAVKFDVYINDDDDVEIRADNTEFAGSFVNVPHKHGDEKKVKTALRLGLTQILEDLDADDDDAVRVTLVPRVGLVSVAGITIEFD